MPNKTDKFATNVLIARVDRALIASVHFKANTIIISASKLDERIANWLGTFPIRYQLLVIVEQLTIQIWCPRERLRAHWQMRQDALVQIERRERFGRAIQVVFEQLTSVRVVRAERLKLKRVAEQM
jgi:hypothetical protein